MIGVLTESQRARKYWSDLKTKLVEEGFEVSDYIGQLKIEAEDGKLRETDCVTTKSAFRIIQSIPSKLKHLRDGWQKLAMIGCKRLKILNWLRNE